MKLSSGEGMAFRSQCARAQQVALKPNVPTGLAPLRELVITRIRSLLDRLQEMDGANSGAVGEPDDSEGLKALARQMLHERACRTRFLPHQMFGEPAWDMLLALFVSDAPLMSKEVLQAGRVPQTTALRWLGFLEQEHLIEKSGHETDGRRTLIRISPQGEEAVAATLQLMTNSACPRGLAAWLEARYDR